MRRSGRARSLLRQGCVGSERTPGQSRSQAATSPKKRAKAVRPRANVAMAITVDLLAGYGRTLRREPARVENRAMIAAPRTTRETSRAMCGDIHDRSSDRPIGEGNTSGSAGPIRPRDRLRKRDGAPSQDLGDDPPERLGRGRLGTGRGPAEIPRRVLDQPDREPVGPPSAPFHRGPRPSSGPPRIGQSPSPRSIGTSLRPNVNRS